MTRTVYYTATTLDGFIATPEHSLDWLLTRDIDNTGPMNYDEFIAKVGAIAMGASTYAWILEHAPGGWEYAMPAWVFTHREFPPPADGADVRFTTDDIESVHAAMVAAAAGKDVWIVGGGDLAGQFADHGLLEEMIVSYAPVTIGAGAPLLPRHVEFRLEELAQNREFACARYVVVRDGE
ncbi:dihydrofolate reductase family protein [Occultella gossypii]|uniref:Dihydrofolate reductase n=1 Tax=Occultella gossypii TaxID=2800820 RepID=A0ABS7S9G1_9MICO|nr:dihydrofolate reductase family protein [Occultella gossypii]MBZ2196897.1 dihydrofolate reductase [Occultella gossypii]